MWIKTRGLTEDEKDAVRAGLPKDFRLPYPYPRNEHEEGMNWVSVNAVVSGRADW
jgi:hypothetical protein